MKPIGQTAMQLGECLYAIVALAIVVFGIWRARGTQLQAAIVSAIWRKPEQESEVQENEVVEEAVPVEKTIEATPQIPETSQERATIPLTGHIATEDLIVILAAQKKDDNTFRFSANAIYTLVKGNRHDVLELIRVVQGKK